jgi:crotonobetainyl-CoA:carnitine CoA-transferase CaiB-like acyl-CoA transferase
VPLIAGELEKQTADIWLSEFDASGIPAGPVNSIGEAFNDPHVIERQTATHIQRDDLDAVPSVRSPIRFRNCQADMGRAAPALGDSTESVLREIGLTEGEINTLLNDRVIAKAAE